MTRRWAIVAAAAICVVAARNSHAHFLFIQIGPHAEAGRTAEVYFSAQALAGDPTFVEKIAHTQLWSQAAPGQFQPIRVRQGADRLRAFVPESSSVAVTGACEYGVLTRNVSFLLRYFPKAIAGTARELNQLERNPQISFEIMATVSGDEVTFLALADGKPIPNVTFTTVDGNLENQELKAKADGLAAWKPPTSGLYSVYAQRVLDQPGELAGKKYREIREFATIAFHWPLERTGADSEAVTLFEQALAARAQWQQFPGFTAKLNGLIDGRAVAGSVRIDRNGSAKLELDDHTADGWIKDQLESIAMHRIASDSGDSADSKPVLRFAEELDDHPFGRLLMFDGGSFASSYRIKDSQIMVVNRQMGKQNMSITVLDNERNAEGRFLPHSYVVQFWEAATGNLRRSDTVQDTWKRVGSFDLPAGHTVTSASEGTLSVRSFMLSEHHLSSDQSTSGTQQ